MAQVTVNQMTDEESIALLTAGLDLSAGIIQTAQQTCGAWPLLPALVHGAVADEVVREEVTAEQEMITGSPVSARTASLCSMSMTPISAAVLSPAHSTSPLTG